MHRTLKQGAVSSLLVLALTVAQVQVAGAQAAQRVVPAGQWSIDNFPVNCPSIATVIAGDEIGDMARAVPGHILINAKRFNPLPTVVKIFIYAHECAHHLYGGDENVADQYAVTLLNSQKWIDDKSLRTICDSMMPMRGDPTHLSGPQRCQMLSVYLKSPNANPEALARR